MVPELLPVGLGVPGREAILGAKLAEPECFDGIYTCHRRYVYRLCLRITRNSAEAEDLTQEVFLQLLRKISTFRGDSAFSTWLHRVAVNVVLMHLRRKSIQTSSESLDVQDAEVPPKEFGVKDHTLAVSIDRIVLERLVNRLPPGYRRILLLHDVEGYEHKEIAKMMQCSVGSSKSQLHKARLKLRSHFQGRSEQASAHRSRRASVQDEMSEVLG